MEPSDLDLHCFQKRINLSSAGQGLNTVQDLFNYIQETLQVIEQLLSGHDLKIPREKNKIQFNAITKAEVAKKKPDHTTTET